ncbi:MAG: hypothetical protein ACRD3E_16140 [Terriglobales bacterium]
MPRRFPIILVLLFCSGLSFAQIRDVLPKPAEVTAVVRDFCRLDYAGSRLSESGWARMKPLTSWTENPAWRSFRVVSRYDQTNTAAGARSARITVRYLPVGTFEMGIGFTPESGSYDAEFTVKQVDEEWRIDATSPDPLMPQVSKLAAVQWLQGKLKTVTDPADKISIETALKQLAGKQEK